jgi:hypothetical protein
VKRSLVIATHRSTREAISGQLTSREPPTGPGPTKETLAIDQGPELLNLQAQDPDRINKMIMDMATHEV